MSSESIMRSVWSATARLPKFPSQNDDIKTDVFIIGGGIAGILTAYFLQQNGLYSTGYTNVSHSSCS